MGGFCCSSAGYQSPAKAQLLNRLEAAGVEMPPSARLFGPRDGWAWRVVGMSGQPPPGGPVGSPWTVTALNEAAAIRVVVQADGTRIVEPAGG